MVTALLVAGPLLALQVVLDLVDLVLLTFRPLLLGGLPLCQPL